MDIKIEIKEEDPLSNDLALQNGKEFFTKNDTMKTNSDVLLDDDCNVTIKTEVESETHFPDVCSQKEREVSYKHLVKQSKSETVTCGNNYKIGMKTEMEEQTLVSDFVSQSEREFLPEDPVRKVKKYNSDHETYNKIEIKEEPWWLETETSSVCADIKDGDFTPVKSPRLTTIRCSNSCEMDTKIEIKEEDPPSDDLATHNEREFFTKNVTMKTDSDTVLLDDCDTAFKTEIKPETSSPYFCLQRECFTKNLVEQVKSETNTCSNCETEIKTKIGSHKEREFLPVDPVMMVKKCNSGHEMDNKIEIKEEPWCLETETSSICDDIRDGHFAPVKLSRLCTEAVSDNSSGDSPMHSAEHSGKITSNSYGKDFHECESQSGVTKILHLEKHLQLEQFSDCSNGEVYSRLLLVSKGEISHMCNICDKSFTHLTDLKLHKLIHQSKKPHRCETCKKSFTQLSNLKTHTLIHQGKKAHQCEICEKSYTRLSNLKTHNLIHQGKKPHKCEICEKSFTLLHRLNRHKWTHEGKKPHKCEICEKRFTRLSDLKVHNLIHEGKRPHKCEVCHRSFIHLSYLKRHMFIHDSEKPFKCDICEKGFIRLSYLKSHNLIHEGKQPYKCKVCEKSFPDLSHLKRHTLIHEGKRPHKCGICEKRFRLSSHLKRHNLLHEGKKPHICNL